MEKFDSNKAQQIARAARTFEQQTADRLPSSITVVLSGDTLLITLYGTMSPAETSLAESREGTAQLREFHRQVFMTTSEPLRKEIRRITGVEVRQANAEVDPSTGTMVQMFWLARKVPADTWSGSDPGQAAAEEEPNGESMPAT